MVETLRNYIAIVLVAYGFTVCYQARVETAILMSGVKQSNQNVELIRGPTGFTASTGAGKSNWTGAMGWINLDNQPKIDTELINETEAVVFPQKRKTKQYLPVLKGDLLDAADGAG